MTWGRRTGKFVEKYFYELYEYQVSLEGKKYIDVNEAGATFNSAFSQKGDELIRELKHLETITFGSREGDTDWLLNLLKSSGRAELALKLLHSALNESGYVDVNNIEIERELKPGILKIGINSPTTPDFIIPQFSVVGDIKTGLSFEMKYQLTCTGYALAYENETGKDINWGIIYFIPTRIPYRYARVLNYPQIHIFPINQELRQWFLDNRDEAYRLISLPAAPEFPSEEKRQECPHCKYKEHCVGQGLTLE